MIEQLAITADIIIDRSRPVIDAVGKLALLRLESCIAVRERPALERGQPAIQIRVPSVELLYVGVERFCAAYQLCRRVAALFLSFDQPGDGLRERLDAVDVCGRYLLIPF